MHAADEPRGLPHCRGSLSCTGAVIDADVEGNADQRNIEVRRDIMALRAHECGNSCEARGNGCVDGLEAWVFLHLHGTFNVKWKQEDDVSSTTDHPGPPWQGRSASKGQSVKVINTHGNQVVDFWAFNAGDLREYLGMEHCRAFWTRLFPVAGDKMVTNRRRPILTMTKDHSPAATTR